MTDLFEVVAQVQQNDLAEEEKRIKAEAAAREALAAKRRLPNQVGLGKLLDMMYGDGADSAPLLDVPKPLAPEAAKERPNGTPAPRFPPPPTSGTIPRR